MTTALPNLAPYPSEAWRPSRGRKLHRTWYTSRQEPDTRHVPTGDACTAATPDRGPVWLRPPAASTFHASDSCQVWRRPMLPKTREAFSFRSRWTDVVRLAPVHGVDRSPMRVLFVVAASPQVISCAASN